MIDRRRISARDAGALCGDVLLDLLHPVRFGFGFGIKHVFEQEAPRRDRGGRAQEAMVQREGEGVRGERGAGG